MLSQKILKDPEVIQYKNSILIVIIVFYILYYAKISIIIFYNSQHLGYLAYIDNITKYVIENIYCISSLVIYKTVK